MEKTYVEQREGGYWISNTRISLDSIVYAFTDVSLGCHRKVAMRYITGPGRDELAELPFL